MLGREGASSRSPAVGPSNAGSATEAIIASNSGFRTRVVALRDDWWLRDQGPMLGQLADSKNAVALLSNGPKNYTLVDAKAGTQTKVTPDVAATLSGFAFSLYRPFPDGALKLMDVVKFGTRRGRKLIDIVVSQ